MVILPTANTEATDALCKEIAKKSNGVCFLGFSRGKDSLCAWLNLRRYFKRVIPFHCASWCGMRFAKEYLDYCEYEMQTKILRLMGEDFPTALSLGYYQPLGDYPAIERMPEQNYSKLDVLSRLRLKLHLPRVWCAFGISMNYSIDRRIYCQKTGGMSTINKTFYPCFDWTKDQIIETLQSSGLKLSSEYRYTNRTLGNIPSYTVNKVLREHYPADYVRMLAHYPWAEAKTVREEILDRKWLKAKEDELVAKGGRKEGDGPLRKEDVKEAYMEDDGTEVTGERWIEEDADALDTEAGIVKGKGKGKGKDKGNGKSKKIEVSKDDNGSGMGYVNGKAWYEVDDDIPDSNASGSVEDETESWF